MKCSHIHTYYPNKEIEEETVDAWDKEKEALFQPGFCNGNNEVVKIFNQECVICFETDSVNASRQCGHQCMGESCYHKKCEIDMLKCALSIQGEV